MRIKASHVALAALLVALVYLTLDSPAQRYPIGPGGNVVSYTTALVGWTGKSVTTNGVARFFLTDDGTINGQALYTTINSIIATSNLDVADPVQVPICSVKSISADLKTIDVNVISGTNITVIGSGLRPSMVFVPTNAIVFLLVAGQ